MRAGIFDLFRIGIGPSSSHTVGPMRAAQNFALLLERRGIMPRVSRVLVELFGSLALTGIGHGTDRAVLLGLLGELPETVDIARIEDLLAPVKTTHLLSLLARYEIAFDPERCLRFHKAAELPGHPNALRFTAEDAAGGELSREVYYSVGGGFIRREGESPSDHAGRPLPYPFSSAQHLLDLGRETGLPIWAIVLEDELTRRPREEIFAYIRKIWTAMQECANRGLTTEGLLPGGLRVQRRASALFKKVASGETSDPLAIVDFVNAVAIAVSEENAAGGRVVTAPTNGAAGILPAIAYYYQRFVANACDDGLARFFLTASAVGSLYEENASLSGAEVGCQGEVGVACSMAAAGLTAAQNGTNEQVEHAAEIAMEHHLGMTCDPVGGFVQIPCIERNAMGAVKAITACRMAMQGSGEHKVSLDQIIRTMYETGLDMQSKYKETSLAGLAVNIRDCG